jgi:hypothetical protein
MDTVEFFVKLERMIESVRETKRLYPHDYVHNNARLHALLDVRDVAIKLSPNVYDGTTDYRK